MSLPKVLIADPEDAFREGAAAALEGRFHVACCTRGDLAWEEIRAWNPDLVIMDLFLPELDGVELLRRLRDVDNKPLILVVTAMLHSDYVRSALENLEVSYAMVKPCRLRSLTERVRELVESRQSRNSCPEELLSVLTQLGLDSGRQGYQDLLVGIPMLARQRNQRLGKELYDAIARENGSSPSAVEKAIRDTIKAAWEKGSGPMWRRLFPGAAKCPANKEFLFRLADLIRVRQKCG